LALDFYLIYVERGISDVISVCKVSAHKSSTKKILSAQMGRV
jgi:hypothetical protein